MPKFSQLLNIATVCNCSISEILQGYEGPFSKGIFKCVIPQTSFRKRFPKELSEKNVQEQLEKLVMSVPPIRPSEAARLIGVSRKYLHRKFHGITKVMLSQWRSYQAIQSNQNFEYSCTIFRQAVITVAETGKYPSRRRVSAITGKNLLLRIKKKDAGAITRITKEVWESNQ